jgi:hypothetical protein
MLPLSASDLVAGNWQDNEIPAHRPYFHLWQQYGICCRDESPILRLREIETKPLFVRLRCQFHISRQRRIHASWLRPDQDDN